MTGNRKATNNRARQVLAELLRYNNGGGRWMDCVGVAEMVNERLQARYNRGMEVSSRTVSCLLREFREEGGWSVERKKMNGKRVYVKI